MTAPPATAAPEFRLHGEISPALISALARLLISHARQSCTAKTFTCSLTAGSARGRTASALKCNRSQRRNGRPSPKLTRR